jgi:hypothetical protein
MSQQLAQDFEPYRHQAMGPIFATASRSELVQLSQLLYCHQEEREAMFEILLEKHLEDKPAPCPIGVIQNIVALSDKGDLYGLYDAIEEAGQLFPRGAQ